MRVATWNVNSIRARISRVKDFLDSQDIDILLMQEIKCLESEFPLDEFIHGGLFGSSYEVAINGQKQWNGVAIASRVGISDVQLGFPSQPAYQEKIESRAIFATCDGIRVASLYAPNGRAVGHEHYFYKLDWYQNFIKYCQTYQDTCSSLPLLLGGDWNVIPTDADTFDVNAHGGLYLSEAERGAWNNLSRARLFEITNSLTGQYTFWDYQRGSFPKNHGLRIDHIWADQKIMDRVQSVSVVTQERSQTGSSDHAPVVAEIL